MMLLGWKASESMFTDPRAETLQHVQLLSFGQYLLTWSRCAADKRDRKPS